MLSRLLGWLPFGGERTESTNQNGETTDPEQDQQNSSRTFRSWLDMSVLRSHAGGAVDGERELEKINRQAEFLETHREHQDQQEHDQTGSNR